MELFTAEKFSDLVSEIMIQKNISMIDAIVDICETRGLDLEVVPELLTPKLKKTIQGEAKKLYMLKKRKRKNYV